MGLENSDFIPEMVPTNPTGTDPKSEGDDHLNLIKRSVLNSFSGLVGTQADPKTVTLSEDQINDAALKLADQLITGRWQHDNDIVLGNADRIQGRNAADDADFALMSLLVTDIMRLGSNAGDAELRALASFINYVDNIEVTATTTRDLGSLLVRDIGGANKKAGFRNPSRAVFTSRAVDQADEGQVLQITAAAVAATMDTLDEGTTLRFMVSGGDVTLTAGAGATLRLYIGDATGPNVTSINVVASGILECYFSAGFWNCFGVGAIGS